MQHSHAIAVTLLLTTALARVLVASELTSEVDSLFRLGMKNTPSALVAAKSQYEQLKRDYPRDRRIDYAYAIVLVNQHKYPESVELLTELQQSGNADMVAGRATIWALVQGRRIADALQEMVTLSQGLADSDDRTAVDKSTTETARFIGAMFGYLELVRPGAAGSEQRTKYRNVVLTNLGDRFVEMFDAGRADVAERLALLQSEWKLAQERKTASITARLERDKATLDGDLGEIANSEEAKQWHLESLRDAQREWNVVNTQLDSLRADRARLSAQIVTIQAQISVSAAARTTVLPTTVIDRRRPGTPELDVSNTTTRTTTTTAGPTSPDFVQIAGLAMALGRINKQAFDMDRRILSLQQRSAELSDRGSRDAGALDHHDVAVQRIAKRAKALEKRIDRESAASKASTPVLTSQMRALSTYLPFPYEQERKRVLAWFEK